MPDKTLKFAVTDLKKKQRLIDEYRDVLDDLDKLMGKAKKDEK